MFKSYVGIYNFNTLDYNIKLECIETKSNTDFVYIPNSNLIGISTGFQNTNNAKVINFDC